MAPCSASVSWLLLLFVYGGAVRSSPPMEWQAHAALARMAAAGGGDLGRPGPARKALAGRGCDGRTSSGRIGVSVRLYGDFRAGICSRNRSSGPRICSSGHDFPLWPKRDRGRWGRPAINAPSSERARGCRGRPRATATATPRRRAAGGGA